MKDEVGLRKYIVTILDDIRGDNQFPTDEVVQANASLLLTRFINDMREIIGKDDTNSDNGYFRDRNDLRKEQRERLEAKSGLKR